MKNEDEIQLQETVQKRFPVSATEETTQSQPICGMEPSHVSSVQSIYEGDRFTYLMAGGKLKEGGRVIVTLVPKPRMTKPRVVFVANPHKFQREPWEDFKGAIHGFRVKSFKTNQL